MFIDNLFGRKKPRPLTLPQASDTSRRSRKAGEQTSDQSRGAGLGGFGQVYRSNEVCGLPCPVQSYATYREMRACPTLAIARAAAFAPVIAAEVGYDGDDDEITAFVESQIGPLWQGFVNDAVTALDYGWKPFEAVYGVGKYDSRPAWLLEKLKPLAVDHTEVLVQKTGQFAGIRNGGLSGEPVVLAPGKALIYTYDGEDGNWYGRSRMENVREHAYHHWKKTLAKMDVLTDKVSGIVADVTYPPFAAMDENGKEVDPAKMAAAVIQSLGQAHGVSKPIMLDALNETSPYSATLIRLAEAGVDVMKMLSWDIQFHETSPGHIADMLAKLQEHNKDMIRGWLLPERAIAEGTSGTRADAESHADVAVSIAQHTLNDLVNLLNHHLIPKLIAFNFGAERAESTKLTAPQLGSDESAWLRELTASILKSPEAMRKLSRIVDIDAMLSEAHVPKVEGVLDIADTLDEQAAEADAKQREKMASMPKSFAMSNPAGGMTVDTMDFMGANNDT